MFFIVLSDKEMNLKCFIIRKVKIWLTVNLEHI